MPGLLWIPSSSALVLQRGRRRSVHFEPVWVLPFHRTEEFDLSIQTITLERRGPESIRCTDQLRVDLVAHLMLRIRPDEQAILRIADDLGAARVRRLDAPDGGVRPLLAQALDTVIGGLSSDQLRCDRAAAQAEIMQALQPALPGFILCDLVLEALRPLPLDELDPSEPLDAQAHTRISQIAARALRGVLERRRADRDVAQKMRMDLARARLSRDETKLVHLRLKDRCAALEARIAELRTLLEQPQAGPS